MNRLACRRLLLYICFIGFIVFVSQLMLRATSEAILTWKSQNLDYHSRTMRDVLELSKESPEPRVNAMCAQAKEVYLLILINSAPANFYLRWTIRKTWGSLKEYRGKNIRVVFIIGETETKNYRLRSLIEKESNRAEDIVIGDFMDTYYNLTAKTLYGMNWVRNYCSNAEFIIKGDDDVLISAPTVIDYLSELPAEERELLYEGSCQIGHGPMRLEGQKWYISENDYPNTTYPPYHLGVAVLHSSKALDSLYQACYRVPQEFGFPINFPFDDVFIGICAQLTDIEVTCNRHIIVWDDDKLRLFAKSRRPSCLHATSLAIHGLEKRHVVQRRWNMIMKLKTDTNDMGKFDNCSFNTTERGAGS